MKKPILFSLLLFLWAFTMHGQKKPNELLNDIKDTKTDTAKINIYFQIADYYQHSHFDSALYYFNKSLRIARQNKLTSDIAYLLLGKSQIISYQGKYHSSIDTARLAIHYYKLNNNLNGIAKGLNAIGVNFYNLSEYDSCRAYWLKCKDIHQQTKDSLEIATNYTNLGVVDYVQSRTESALNNFIKALEIRKAKNQKKGLASIYMKIALIYQNQVDKPREAYHYLKQAIKLYETQNNQFGKAKALVNLSNVYEQLDSTKNAELTLQKSRQIAEKIGNKRLLGSIYNNIATFYKKNTNYDKAIQYYYKARDLFKNLEQKRELLRLYYDLATIFYSMEDYPTAIAYLESSIETSKEIKTYETRDASLKLIAKAYAKQKKFQKAYKYHQKYGIAKDSIAEHEKQARLEELEARYAGKQKAQQIKILEKQQELNDTKLKKATNTRNFFLLIAALIVILAVLIYLKYRQKIHLNKELRQRNKEVREKNKEISKKSRNINEYNKMLLEKNKLIEHQKQEMEEASHTKDRIFSIIGHDLRSPLSSLKTSLKLIKSGALTPQKHEKVLQLMETDIDATMDLLENLLMWAKNQDKALNITAKEASVTEIVEDAIEGVQGLATNKSINIKLNTQANYKAFFDENMIAVVMRNLLSNAIKFSPQNSEIDIAIQTQSKMVKVAVKDRGVGMSSDVIEKITQRDQYFTQPGTNKEKGSGLGLNLCIDIIEQHDGNLVIESQPGEGSEISFTLPQNKVDHI